MPGGVPAGLPKRAGCFDLRIADLEEAEAIRPSHLAESIPYRTLDRTLRAH